MSSNYVNFVPRSPPPLGDKTEISDDEFGEFSSTVYSQDDEDADTFRKQDRACLTSNTLPDSNCKLHNKDHLEKKFENVTLNSNKQAGGDCFKIEKLEGSSENVIRNEVLECNESNQASKNNIPPQVETSTLECLEDSCTGDEDATSNFRFEDDKESPVDSGIVQSLGQNSYEDAENLSSVKTNFQFLNESQDAGSSEEFNSSFLVTSGSDKDIEEPSFINIQEEEFLTVSPSIINAESSSLNADAQSYSGEFDDNTDHSSYSIQELKLSDDAGHKNENWSEENGDSLKEVTGDEEDEVEDLCFESFQEYGKESEEDFNQEDDNLDFDNFQFVSYSDNKDEKETALRDLEVPVECGEFVADFSEFQSSSVANSAEDDEFNEFESATNVQEDSSCTTKLPSLDLSHSKKNISEVFCTCFPMVDSTELNNSEPVSLDNIMKSSQQCNSETTVNREKCLWTNLYDVDKTPALTFHWNSSVANKKLLSALNVDARNILFGPRWITPVPAYACNLSLNPLEPTKAARAGDFTISHTEISSDIRPTNLTQEYIPPAQFDWSSSGLTNPLDDASNSMLTLLDLEFFTTLEDVNAKPTDSAIIRLESELLGTNGKKIPEFNRPALLEQILTTAKMSAAPSSNSISPSSASYSSETAAELSSEAKLLLDQLPNLSFMQANVLMFPIRGSPTSETES